MARQQPGGAGFGEGDGLTTLPSFSARKLIEAKAGTSVLKDAGRGGRWGMRWVIAFGVLGLVGVVKALAGPVADEARALPEAAEAELAGMLTEVAAATGCAVHVKAVTFLDSGAGMRQEARLARQEATEEEVAMMILFDRSTDKVGISLSPGLWGRYPMAELVEMLREAVEEAGAEGKGIDVRLLDAVEVVRDRLMALEARRRMAQRPVGDEVGFALGYAGMLGALTLGAMGMLWRRRLRRGREQVTHFFPEAEVPQRLGAAYGGGVVGQFERPGV